MEQRPSGEPVGCVALLVGLGALALAVSATPPGQRLLGSLAPGVAPSSTARASTPAAEESAGKPQPALESEAEALAGEVRRLREERMSARKERMLAIAERHREGERMLFHRISLRNECRYVVAVALHYRDLDGSTVTRGWWEVAPRSSVLTDAMTREDAFHLYAENQRVGRTWDGAATKDAITLLVGDEKFDLLLGETPLFTAPRMVSFAKHESGREWTDSVASFDCPVEEMPPRGTVVKPPSAEQGPRSR